MYLHSQLGDASFARSRRLYQLTTNGKILVDMKKAKFMDCFPAKAASVCWCQTGCFSGMKKKLCHLAIAHAETACQASIKRGKLYMAN